MSDRIVIAGALIIIALSVWAGTQLSTPCAPIEIDYDTITQEVIVIEEKQAKEANDRKDRIQNAQTGVWVETDHSR